MIWGLGLFLAATVVRVVAPMVVLVAVSVDATKAGAAVVVADVLVS